MSTASTWLARCVATVALAPAVAVVGCAAEEPAETGASLGRVSSEVRFGMCPSARGSRCSELTYGDVPADGMFYVTDFEGEAMACAGMRWADGTWAYVADNLRFGCGAKVKVEANGKSCVAVVADCGPNKGVEQAAADPSACSSHFPVLDASPLIVRYLYGTRSAGWSDHFKVKVTQVDRTTTEGCPGGSAAATPVASGTSGTCTVDGDCNNGTAGEGTICKGGACVDGCRKTADCPAGGTCSVTDGKSAGACSSKPTMLGTPCASDSECTGGMHGTGRVCSTAARKCIVGCHADTDCGAGAKCDRSGPKWRCVTRKEIGDACGSDAECNGGLSGTQRICSDTTKLCDDACRGPFDCNKGERCGASHKCEYVPDAGADTGASGKCVLRYPSVAIKGIEAPAAFTKSYADRGCSGAPACVIDANNVVDADTGQRLAYSHVKLAPHFTLRELTYQNIASSPYVFVDPDMVTRLETMRGGYGKPINVNSGYRSPLHQRDVCIGQVCGRSSCPGTCALCSDHMGGRAADLQHSSPKCAQAKAACFPGQFHLIYNERAGGDHLHVDTGARNPVCSYAAISCR